MILETNILDKSLKAVFEKGLVQWFTKKMGLYTQEHGSKTTNTDGASTASDAETLLGMFIKGSSMKTSKQVTECINMRKGMST